MLVKIKLWPISGQYNTRIKNDLPTYVYYWEHHVMAYKWNIQNQKIFYLLMCISWVIMLGPINGKYSARIKNDLPIYVY